MANDKAKNDLIHYKVDDEPETTDQTELTPVQIMAGAGLDPLTHYLVLIHGNDETSYKDDPEKKITMKNGMKFITRPTGPMPVS